MEWLKALLEALTVLCYFLVARKFYGNRICWRFPVFLMYLHLRGMQVWIESATIMDRPWPAWAGYCMMLVMALVTVETLRQALTWLPPQEVWTFLLFLAGLATFGGLIAWGYHYEAANVSRPGYHEIRSLVHRGLCLISWGTSTWFWISPHPSVDRQLRAHLLVWAAYLTNKVWPALTAPGNLNEWLMFRCLWAGLNCLILAAWLRVAAMPPEDFGVATPLSSSSSEGRAIPR